MEPIGLDYREDLNNTRYTEKHFGLYRHFTVETQQFYGTKEEIEEVLQIINILKENNYKHFSMLDIIRAQSTIAIERMLNDIPFEKEEEFDPIDVLIEESVLTEMKRILDICKIPYKDNLSSKMMYDIYFDSNKWFIVENYFFFFKTGKRTLYYYRSLLKDFQDKKTSS